MLHVTIPLYRYRNMFRVLDSIPLNEHDDIICHIATSTNSTENRNGYWGNFIYECEKGNPERIKIYELDCDDADTVTKRNTMFENIKDGYFCLLDDDTVFVERMYQAYKECEARNFIGMVVGRQDFKDGTLRLRPSDPYLCGIDAGNVLCHSSILEKVKWAERDNIPKDFVFWDSCFKQFGGFSHFDYVHETISIYNALR